MRLYTEAAKVGLAGMVIILLPSIVMYLLDCVGWRLALGAHASAVSFCQLFLIRTAGEVVNATTPTGYVGGEPLKAYLLERYGIPLVDSSASVIIAKTTMTIAQVAYILVGIGLGSGCFCRLGNFPVILSPLWQCWLALALASLGSPCSS